MYTDSNTRLYRIVQKISQEYRMRSSSMKQHISYLIPTGKGYNIANCFTPEVEHLLLVLESQESGSPINRFEANLCGCLEDECTCYYLDKVERLVTAQ